MPVPQRMNFLWGGHPARPEKPFSRTGKMPVPQRMNFLWGGHPARPEKPY